VRRRSNRRDSDRFAVAGRLAATVAEHPREFVAVVMSTIAVFTIVINALFLQKGPHPAPIFAPRSLLQHEAAMPPRLQSVQSGQAADAGVPARVQLVVNIQRELTRKGFYDGPADGIWGAKTDAAAREFVQAAGLKISPEANEGLLRAITTSGAKPPIVAPPAATSAAADPIAKLIGPSRRMMAVQRALSDFGYGQIKATGTFDPDTRTAIEKFERDHHLPVTGQISDRFIRELAAMTGRPLE
jgi:peptidoglycan hydrolase-like protein with peptidoglycan-binding domain